MSTGVHRAPPSGRGATRPAGRRHWVLLMASLALLLCGACGPEEGAAGPEGNFTILAAGDNHACGVLEGGEEVWCWGGNAEGQVGDGSTVDAHYPKAIFVSGGVIALALGGSHSCALVEDGTVFCWGRNAEGQLGDGTTTQRSIPSPVLQLMAVESIAAGYRHTCAVERGGRALCWGSNDKGQLGMGDGAGPDVCGTNPPMPCALDPAPVLDLTGVVQIAAGGDPEGSHSCALTSLGRLFCWGDNDERQLGDGTLIPSNRPVEVTDVLGVTAVVTGGAHSCVLHGEDAATCWGRRYGSLFPITLLEGIVGISAGRDFDCAQLEDGTLHCWGDNTDGQLGDGTRVDRVIPTTLEDHLVTATALGAGHACAIDDAAQIWCWGRNTEGQLGGSSLQYSGTPLPLGGDTLE